MPLVSLSLARSHLTPLLFDPVTFVLAITRMLDRLFPHETSVHCGCKQSHSTHNWPAGLTPQGPWPCAVPPVTSRAVRFLQAWAMKKLLCRVPGSSFPPSQLCPLLTTYQEMYVLHPMWAWASRLGAWSHRRADREPWTNTAHLGSGTRTTTYTSWVETRAPDEEQGAVTKH